MRRPAANKCACGCLCLTTTVSHFNQNKHRFVPPFCASKSAARIHEETKKRVAALKAAAGLAD